MKFLLDALIGAATGVISGFGVGGGTLLVLYLTLFGGVSQLAAQGINLVYFIPCAAAALVSHVKRKSVDYTAWIFSGGFGTLSAAVSAYFASRVELAALTRVFGIFLTLVGAWEIISVIGEKRVEKKGQ